MGRGWIWVGPSGGSPRGAVVEMFHVGVHETFSGDDRWRSCRLVWSRSKLLGHAAGNCPNHHQPASQPGPTMLPRTATGLTSRASIRYAPAAARFCPPSSSSSSVRVAQHTPRIAASLSTSTAINSRLPNRDRPRFARSPTAGGSSSSSSSTRSTAGLTDNNNNNNHNQPPPARPHREPTAEELAAQRRAQLEHDRALLPAELQAPVHIPDDPEGVLHLNSDPEVANVLGQSALVVTRQIEFLNMFIGFEQANK